MAITGLLGGIGGAWIFATIGYIASGLLTLMAVICVIISLLCGGALLFGGIATAVEKENIPWWPWGELIVKTEENNE